MFKVGDRVKFRDWNDMRKEFGLTERGDININDDLLFCKEMKHLCGTYATIVKIQDDIIHLIDYSGAGDVNWCYCTSMFEKVEERTMDKEKEIKEMADTLEKAKLSAISTIGSMNKGFGHWYATELYNAGYGHIPTAINAYLHSNVKAAAMIDSIVAIKQREIIRQFAEKLKARLYTKQNDETMDAYGLTREDIDELAEEYLKELK